MKEKIILDKIHPTTIQVMKPTKELGEEIIALRYDLILPVIEGMIERVQKEELGDRKRGRMKLAYELKNLNVSLLEVRNNIKNLIKICYKYHEKEKDLE